MLFSERYGYKKIDEALLKENVPEHLRTRIWNVFYKQVFVITNIGFVHREFVKTLWDSFFKKFLDDLKDRLKKALRLMSDRYMLVTVSAFVNYLIEKLEGAKYDSGRI